jgi:hypothetical protein
MILNQMKRISNIVFNKANENIGMTPAIDYTKLANSNNNKSESYPTLPPSLTSSLTRPSKSKMIRKHAINLIRFCLKTGISENKNIMKFLEENGVVLR